MLIKRTPQGEFVANRDDPYLPLDAEQPIPVDGKVLLSVDRLIRDGEAVGRRTAPTGVQLQPGDDVETLRPWASRLGLVVLNFPSFRDGRPYTAAVLLRERLGYGGELRASGNVLREQAELLCRSGFDSFETSDGSSAQEWAGAARRVRYAYQGRRPVAPDPRPAGANRDLADAS
ncbi:MAG TPA: DUF934 domain-containing protein [Roseiarcus sp.]|jgi:uncharacterized protein (DUF934 family)